MTEDGSDRFDPTRRTLLAAERTWLAWWRTGIAAATAAVGVGGLVPNLVEGSRWPYEVLGAGYAAVAIGVFAFAIVRQQRVDAALRRGEQPSMDLSWVIALTLAGGVLALATLAVVVVQP
jgi:putative membrane protein